MARDGKSPQLRLLLPRISHSQRLLTCNDMPQFLAQAVAETMMARDSNSPQLRLLLPRLSAILNVF